MKYNSCLLSLLTYCFLYNSGLLNAALEYQIFAIFYVVYFAELESFIMQKSDPIKAWILKSDNKAIHNIIITLQVGWVSADHSPLRPKLIKAALCLLSAQKENIKFPPLISKIRHKISARLASASCKFLMAMKSHAQSRAQTFKRGWAHRPGKLAEPESQQRICQFDGCFVARARGPWSQPINSQNVRPVER